jgi:hypothetical protein
MSATFLAILTPLHLYLRTRSPRLTYHNEHLVFALYFTISCSIKVRYSLFLFVSWAKRNEGLQILWKDSIAISTQFRNSEIQVKSRAISFYIDFFDFDWVSGSGRCGRWKVNLLCYYLFYCIGVCLRRF